MENQHIVSKFYCGADLHSKTTYICIMDRDGNILLNRNLPNNFLVFKSLINPFLPDLVVGAESTYSYYWLFDGCREAGIPFYLGHAFYMKSIDNNKKKTDPIDAKTIANLLRSNFFPLAYPYPKEMRTTRDLLRRRHRLVRIRAEAFTHIQIISHQYCITEVTSSLVKSKTERRNLLSHFPDPGLHYTIASDMNIIDWLDPQIDQLEHQIIQQAKQHNYRDFALLKTIPGVGEIIALIILYETHDLNRFSSVQKYSSYCRVVRCQRESNGKLKSGKNQKIGNPYLKWAFGQILHHAKICNEPIHKLYQKLEHKHGPARARSMMAHKFAVTVFAMLKHHQAFDEKRFSSN